MIRKLVYKSLGYLGAFEARALEANSKEPRKAQLECLEHIVSRNASSAFGSDHEFSKIKTYLDYKAQVPIREYEAIRPYVDRAADGERSVLTAEDPFMFATTSGTSAQPKLIPVTNGYLKEFRRASVASGYHLLRKFPSIANGVILSVASPAEEGRTKGDIPYGAISGGLFLREPLVVRRYLSPIPYEVFLIRDWQARYYALLRLALCLPLTCIYTLNPSTIVMLVKKLKQHGAQLVRDIYDGTIAVLEAIPQDVREVLNQRLRPEQRRARELQELIDLGCFVPHRIWPLLQVVCCWTKASAAFYLKDFPSYFGSVPVHDITYGASEGRGSVYLGENRQLLSIRSHFYEFIPEDEIDSPNPQILLADELSINCKYFILMTTSGGLYRYHINDVVKVVGFHNRTPLLEFQYKGSNICSFTGEKVSEIQVTEAMSRTLAKQKVKVEYFTVVPEFYPNPHYELWIEPAEESGAELSSFSRDLEAIAQSFDQHLSDVNIEYLCKRQSLRLDSVSAKLIHPGSYENLRKRLSSQGIADAQIKVSHLNPKDEIRAYFKDALFDLSLVKY